MPVITAAARRQIHHAAAIAGATGLALRIAARHNADTGETEYGIGFDERREQDEASLSDDITVLVSPLSAAAVADLTVDYVEIAPGDFQFIFYRSEALPAAADTPQASACAGGSCGGGCASRR